MSTEESMDVAEFASTLDVPIQTRTLYQCLQSIKVNVEKLYELRQGTDDLNVTKDYYQKELVSDLIDLRRLNREEKCNLEKKYHKIKELNQQLVRIQQDNECIRFEASCIGYNISALSTGDPPRDVDHQIRMKQLEEEEERRKALVKNLEVLVEDVKLLELSCEEGAEKLSTIRPFIEQLIDKAEPQLQSQLNSC